MESEQKFRLGTACLKIGSGATPRGGKEAYKGGATALIRSQNIYNEGFHRNGLAYIDDKQAAELSNVEVRASDVLLNITGDSVARCCQVANDVLPARVNQHVAIIRPRSDKLDARFLRYVLVSPLFQSHLLALASAGATRNALTKSMIEELEVTAPPLAEQQAIAAVLGALDDKIELNRRMNATLEAMARALFQSWFVDFDPVRANLDRRAPSGLDSATAALFPASFRESELGRIPKDWTVGKVGDLATLNRDAVNPGDFPTETFDHFSLPAFDAGRTAKVELGIAIMSNKLVVKPNSVLLSKLNPHIPRIWLPDLDAMRRSVCSTEFMVASSKPGVTREYLFSLFTSSAFASVYGTLVTGTTGSHQRIRSESVFAMPVSIPPRTLIQAFTAIAKPLFDHVNRNTEQSRTLATIRDTLLPRLLSRGLKPPD
ncbi:MAG: restriction endonuclease subunit S [Chthoniobacterales bacterium]|nr:restriction endonuclease subunit S [Chthoniobacterales bacterium]